jgi:hypothetical protein
MDNWINDIYLYDTFKRLTEPLEFNYTCETAKIEKMRFINHGKIK